MRLGIIRVLLIIIGVILIADELHEFGLPFGPFLPNLSFIEQFIHHWMIGVVLIFLAVFISTPRLRRRVC